MSNSILETQQLSKSFKGITSSDQATPVIKNLNLHIKAGETLAVVGASGAGKSTLLHVLGGLDQADSGRVLWNGNNIADWSVKKLGQQRNKTLGFIYQFHHLLPEFNALDNVAMTMRIGGHSKTESQQKAAEVLERMGLAHRLKHRPAELSGGERQRVAIARALINNPQAILADEPTGNLDHQTANHVFEQLLQTTRDQNTALVIVTHSIELAKRCAQVMHLEKGRLQLSSSEPSPA